MDTKPYSTLILKNCLRFSFKNIKLIILTLIIEYFLIYMETISSIGRILLRLNIIDQNFSISAFSPSYLFNNMKNSNCSAGYCQFQNIYFYIVLITISVLVIVFLIIILFEKYDNSYEKENSREGEKITSQLNLNIASNNSTDTKSWKSITLKIIKYFCINLLDLVTFKILGLFVFSIIFDKIIYGVHNSGAASNSLVHFIVGVIFLAIFLFIYMYQIDNINIMIQFNPQLSYHYDNKFSKSYDYILLFLKIVIALENNLYFSTIFGSTATNSNETILFFDIIVLISILAFTLKIVYQIISMESIFFINKKLNTCRLFFLFFNSVSILTIFIFISAIEKSIFLLVVIVSMLIFSACAIYFVLRVHPNPIYLKDRYISQLIEIIHECYSIPTEHFNNKIIKIHGMHVNFCIAKNSTLMMNEKCLICENINLNHFTQNFLNQTKALIKNKIIYLSREEKLYFKFAKLISAERGWLGPTEEKSLIYKTKLLLERKKFSDKNFLSNLSLFFEYVNVYDKTNETKFNLIKKYDETNQLIFSSIEKLQEVFLLFDSNSKKDFYPLALSLNKNKESIMKNIHFFMTNKNIFSDLYSLVIIRHNFEKLYNCPLGDNDTVYEMDSQEEALKEFYLKDKFINMIYNIKNNKITIFNASRQFVKYKKKSFEEMFPKIFRKYGVNNYLVCLKNHYEGFNYEYIVQAENYYIGSIRLTSSLLKSINLEELMIISKFDTKKEELIVFQEFGDEKNKDYLVTFSETLSKILFLHPKWIETIKKFNNYVMLSMNKIFEKSLILERASELDVNYQNSHHHQNSNINSRVKNTKKYSNEIYNLNYNSYYTNIYSKLIKYINEHFDTDPLAEIYQNEIEKLSNANYQIKVRISFKYQIYNNDYTPCNVYSFKTRKQKREPNYLDNKHSNTDEIGASSITKFDEDSSVKVYTREMSQYTANSQSSLGRESFSNLYTKREVEKKVSELNRFTVVTLFINICLIIFCIIFLAIGLINNKYLNDLNTLQISFKKFESNFVSTALNVFISVGVYPQGTTDYSGYITDNIFDKYKNNPKIAINLLKYMNNELTVKVDVLKTYMLQFQYNIHYSNYATELEGIMQTQVNYYSISQLGDNLILSTTNVAFTDMINLLMTNGRAAVYTFDYNLIYIISFDIITGVADFSNIYDKNMTITQRMVYELAMNYPNYLKNFKLLEGSINKILETAQIGIFNQNLSLTFTLIGLHVLLIIISVVIINHLKKSTNDHNKYLVKTITPEVSKYMQSKLFILKDLNEYYHEAPSKLVSKFKILKKEFIAKFDLLKKKTKNEKKDDSSSTILQNNRFSESNGKIKLDRLLTNLAGLLCGIFLVYYLYAFVFFFSFYLSNNSLIAAFDYLNLMQAVNINSVNDYILHQTLQFTNQTDLNYSSYLIEPANPYTFGVKAKNYNYVENSGYIEQTLEILKQMIVELLKIERDSASYLVIKTVIDTTINCSNLYTNTDEIISQYVGDYPQGTLINALTMFCESIDFMQNPDFHELVFEADYTMMQLLSDLKFADGNYLMIKDVNKQGIYFEMLAILSLIVRPAQSYVLNSVIIPLVDNATNSYLLTIIIFLICNIWVDIIIFIMIKQKLIKRVTEINTDIKCLLECIAS